MNAASLRLIDFDRDSEDSGARLLDTIFQSAPFLRDRISMQTTRQCCDREVLLKVDYSEKAELGSVLHVLCSWLSKEGNIEEVENIMLF